MFKSIQWKLVLIYSLIILFAMQFFAVFLSQALEDYYLDSFSKNMESQGLLLVTLLERDLANTEETTAIDSLVLEYSKYAGTSDIMVLDAFGRVISSSNPQNDFRGQRIIQEEITRALTGIRSEAIRLDPESRERMKYLALPVRHGDKNLGVVYLIGSLEPTYRTLREIQLIFLTGTILVIGLTVILGFILARTITAPIQEVTSKAGQIAHGDFGQKIIIHSEDEIGHLGVMFNYLSSQLKQTLEEISSEKGKVEAILQHMTDGIVALGRDGKILHVNPTARHLLSLQAGGELEREVLEQLVSGIDVTDIMLSGLQKTREITLSFSRIILATYVPFQTQDNAALPVFSGVLIVLHDVTKERELTRMQQEFVANVSHELRTPLTTLKSYTETLLAGAMLQPDTCLSFLSTMEKEIERMVRLVKDLLVLSQMDHKQVGWLIEAYSIGDLIAEVADDLQVKYKAEPRDIYLKFPPQPVVACIDRDKVKQVLLNIIGNAYKFTKPDGKIAITLEEKQGQAIIEVKDNGIGIPPEDTERVFERFYRVDKARSREYGGTGLGLSIAREIVTAHQGTLSIKSEYGTETTVILTLPLNLYKEDAICKSA